MRLIKLSLINDLDLIDSEIISFESLILYMTNATFKFIFITTKTLNRECNFSRYQTLYENWTIKPMMSSWYIEQKFRLE